MVKITLISGNGRGKTSTAIGSAYIAKYQGKEIIVAQFLKTGKDCGECNYFRDRYQLRWFNFGKDEFYVSEKQLEEFRELILQGIIKLNKELEGQSIDIIILDELGIALSYGLLKWANLQTILDAVNEEIIITGREIPEILKEQADDIIHIEQIKHPYEKGILARKGIDY